MSRVRIADMVIEMTHTDTAFFEHRLAAYRDDGDTREPDLRVTFSTPTDMPAAVGETVACNERLQVTTLADGRRHRALHNQATGQVVQTITTTPAFEVADICVWKNRAHPTLSLTDFEYMLTGLVFSDRLTELGGMVLHGSSIAFDGRGLIFSAPSGTGKSTHAGLWRERYGERVVTVNDDKPAIRFSDTGEVMVYGTPWSGKTELNTNIAVPLTALVFLERSPHNAIRRLTAGEAMLYIGRELALPYHSEALCERLWDTAARLIQAVPVYLLSCTPDVEAAELVHDAVFEGE